eukprot:snap_masked-scaffold_86-processed-gene-0.14-mRNA-1 protein AED:0.24 eAED:1.00 QI:0/0/0/1/1/1/2/0/217
MNKELNEYEVSKLRSLTRKTFITSYDVFCAFAPINPNTGRSDILTKLCFNTWIRTRKRVLKQPELSFRKALIAHTRGKDGRKPFTRTLESIILSEVRKTQIWPCFEGSKNKKVLNIGCKTFKSLGFHEGKNTSNKKITKRKRETEEEMNMLNYLFYKENQTSFDSVAGSIGSEPTEKKIKIEDELLFNPEVSYDNDFFIEYSFSPDLTCPLFPENFV